MERSSSNISPCVLIFSLSPVFLPAPLAHSALEKIYSVVDWLYTWNMKKLASAGMGLLIFWSFPSEGCLGAVNFLLPLSQHLPLHTLQNIQILFPLAKCWHEFHSFNWAQFMPTIRLGAKGLPQPLPLCLGVYQLWGEREEWYHCQPQCRAQW